MCLLHRLVRSWFNYFVELKLGRKTNIQLASACDGRDELEEFLLMLGAGGWFQDGCQCAPRRLAACRSLVEAESSRVYLKLQTAQREQYSGKRSAGTKVCCWR